MSSSRQRITVQRLTDAIDVTKIQNRRFKENEMGDSFRSGFRVASSLFNEAFFSCLSKREELTAASGGDDDIIR
jgi:hypothetical protein